MSSFDGEYRMNIRQPTKKSVGSQDSSEGDVSPLTSRKVSMADNIHAKAHGLHHSYTEHDHKKLLAHPDLNQSQSFSGPSYSYKGFHSQGRTQSVPPLQHPIKPKTRKSLFGKFINSIKEDNRRASQAFDYAYDSKSHSSKASNSRMPSVSSVRDQFAMSSNSSYSPHHIPQSPSSLGPKDSFSSIKLSHNPSIANIGSLRDNDFSQSVVAIDVNELNNMEGIVSSSETNGASSQSSVVSMVRKDTWAAPESWDVKNIQNKHATNDEDDDDDYVIRKTFTVQQLDDKVFAEKSLDTKKYHVRVYAEDDDFSSILKRPFNETAEELITFLKKKYQLVGDYKISLRIGKVTKKLEPKQKPIKIQTNLLLLSGYLDDDKLDDLGRFDLSYLFKFILHHDVLKQLTPSEEEHISRDLVHVNLTSKDLQKIPALCYSSKVQSLDVSNNGDITLPLDFFQMSDAQLSNLRMVNIRTKVFPPNVVHAKELGKLDLEQNFISMIPENVSMLKNLTALNLKCNRLTSLPKLPSNLKILDISSNDFSTYPETINDLKSLLQVDLSYNKITKLPTSINKLTSVKKFLLSSNYLTEIDINLPNVKTLNLKHNAITNIELHDSNVELLYLTNNFISNLAGTFLSLKTLDLQRNPITQLNISSPNLASLHLSKAKLTALPEVIFSFTKLEKLELSKNALRELPDISSLSNLRELSIFSNNLESLPSFESLEKLQRLDVHDNNLKSIPDLSFIQIVNISSNLISELPEPKSKNVFEFRAADNQLDDNALYVIKHFTELRLLSLAYNKLVDIPSGTLSENVKLGELYLSGNSLTTLPDDLENIEDLRILCLNSNRFKTLSSDLARFKKLQTIDVGSNDLKYNTSNYKYEWNWKENQSLRHLNLSGNKKFEITEDLNLPNLNLLGLMDLTITTQTIPDESINIRVRTTPTTLGDDLQYGISDRLCSPRVTARDSLYEKIEGGILICLFDGLGSGKVSYIVRDDFHKIFEKELKRSDIVTALRHTFLQLNTVIYEHNLHSQDGVTGCTVTAVYVKGHKVYTANIGDTMSMLAKPDGSYSFLTVQHQPSKVSEFDRIRTSGGFVSTDDKVDGVSQVSRAAGFLDLLPHIHTGPDISETKFDDEILVIGTKELFDYLPSKTIADVVSQGDNSLRSAERLRDYAISYGCDTKVSVIVLTRRKATKQALPVIRQQVEDSNLRRLKPEIQPPIGELAMVFTDIKNSTSLWENYPLAMRSSIRTHNDIMRRQLHIVGGYEVKTEGDAFMVSFPTVTSAMIWCFNVQQQLLLEDWPAEILQSEEGREFFDAEDNLIYKGLSVRMGIHWGVPVCEPDIITRRMDYFGPMVNKTARVCAVADGGEITLTLDCLNELKRIEKAYKRSQKGKSIEESFGNGPDSEILAKEFSILSNIDWMYEAMGKVQLKGLETEEEITVIFPKQLKSRYKFQRKPELYIEGLHRLKKITQDLDRINSTLFGHSVEFKGARKGDLPDQQVFELLITRIEYIAAMLALRDQTVGLFHESVGIFELIEKVIQVYQEHENEHKI